MNTLPSDAVASPSASRWRTRLTRAVGFLLLGVGLWYGICWGIWHHHSRALSRSLRHRDFDEALVHASWCRWAWASDGETWLLSARTARRAGRFDLADEWLDQAKERGARPRLVLLERTLLRAKGGHFGEVEERLHDLLRASRLDYPFIAEVLTDEYMRQYRFSEARDLLNRWIDLSDEDIEPYLRRGWVAEHQLDLGQALSDYRVVLEHEPGRDPVRLRVAEILLKLRRPAQALEELTPLQQRGALSVEAALLVARCWRERSRLDEAEAALDALPDGERQVPRVLAERGHIALARGQGAGAEKLFRLALRDLPRESDLLYALQQALLRQGKTPEAEEVGRTRQDAEADTRRMTEVMSKLRLAPTDPELRFECAQIFLRNNMTDDGVRWLKLALEVRPEHQQAHEQLAACLEKQGAKEQAAYHRAAARRLGGG